MNNKPKTYATTAGIAAELHHAAKIARKVSLIAKNARTISMRAGERAIGFKPITIFINEFAENTIQQANKINMLAISISKLAVEKSHAENTYEKINAAWVFAGKDSHRATLPDIYDRISINIATIDQKIKKLFQQLVFELDETEMQIRAANLLATSSKTEASRAGEYQESLNVIACNIEDTASAIRSHLRNARRALIENETTMI